jgi:hypothetical protein
MDRKTGNADATGAKLSTAAKTGAGLINNNLGSSGGSSPPQQSPPGSPGNGSEAKPSMLFKKVCYFYHQT